MNDLKTQEEAEIALSKSIDHQFTKFCPLVRTLCVRHCECFNPGRIWTPSGRKSDVRRMTPACCGNAMFSGERM